MNYTPRHISHPNKVRFVVRIEIDGVIAGDYVLYARTSKTALRRAETIAKELNPTAKWWELTVIESPMGKRSI